MKINLAIFASAFHPHLGGVEELCRQLAKEYSRQGHECIVLTNRWPRSLPRHEVFEGIPIYRLAFRVPEGNFRVRFNYGLTHNFICREMLGILRRHQINLLHVQCVSSNGYYALLAKRSLPVALVTTAQGERTMDAAGIYQHSPFQNQVLRSLLKESQAVTACSQNTLDDILAYAGDIADLPARSKVIYNGIDLAEFEKYPARQHPRPYIAAIGRHVPQKGFDVLLRALALARVPHDLLLAGEGPETQRLKQLAGELSLRDRVHFLGRADRPAAVGLFKGAEFFVLPSRLEPQGIVNLEAMAAGNAVIASRTGGVPEIVQEGVTGLLVPPDDPNALAAKLQELSHDATLRERLGHAGRARAADFSWPRIAGEYLNLYEAAACGPAEAKKHNIAASRDSLHAGTPRAGASIG